MSYSKISNIELTNFMSFKKAKISFDESGIINIKGYNDSGKSAILRAIAVCLMDMFKTKQLKFIRHGEEYFRVVVTFDDGVSILRDKYLNGQSLYEVYKNGELIFTTKQGNRLSKVDKVPEPIAEYLGLCVTDSVYLNYQSCIDKLPVVDTTGSENYQMFHEVLRMEEIFIANNMINLDKNDLALDISTMEYNIQRDEVLLGNCSDVSQELIDTIVELDKESTKTNTKKDKLDTVKSIIEGYENIKDIPSIQKIPYKNLADISEIASLVSTLESSVSIPSMSKVSTKKLNSLYNLVSIVDNLQNLKDIPRIEKVDTGLVVDRGTKIKNILSIYEELLATKGMCNTLDSNLEQAKNQLDGYISKAREEGVSLVKCGNCGTYSMYNGGSVNE